MTKFDRSQRALRCICYVCVSTVRTYRTGCVCFTYHVAHLFYQVNNFFPINCLHLTICLESSVQFSKMLATLRYVARGELVRHLHTTRAFQAATTAAGDPEIQKKIKDVVSANKVVVFMKGTKAQPMCGFSKAVVQVLHMHAVKDFKDFNVLEDEKVRQDKHPETFSTVACCWSELKTIIAV